MSSRTPIQVPEELKVSVEGLQSELHSKTNYGVIERLIEQYQSFKKFREEQRKKWEDEKNRQAISMIQASSDTKKMFNALKDRLGLKTEEDVLVLLLDHFSSADQMKKGTFNMYLKLRNK